ncbi:hypothetical protein V6N12_018069 [Hibiscus sabdariffa]|uniref:F-box domain-containing protein n=1 Tax=Hibiscus sabdariffa TaxID=183260 RepID=A0ABR2AQA1_9ROSI
MSLVTEEIKASASEVYHGDEICQEKSKSLLQEMGMPRGLLPLKDIEECGYVKDTGLSMMNLQDEYCLSVLIFFYPKHVAVQQRLVLNYTSILDLAMFHVYLPEKCWPRSTIMEYDENLMDRISELPQELLARILCLLPFEEVVRTTGPVLFHGDGEIYGSLSPEGYVEWITRVLNSHQAPTIDELRVRCDLTPKYTRKIDRWIEVALMKKVRRLELDFQSRSWKRLAADEYGEFPDSECYEFGQKLSS